MATSRKSLQPTISIQSEKCPDCFPFQNSGKSAGQGQATGKQPASNRQATGKQPASNRQATGKQPASD
jgi:hypothetical protein